MTATNTAENTALATVTTSANAMILDDHTMQRIERVADLMASGRATVPAHLQRNKGDCFAICLQAMRWGMDPFVVGQKTHVVQGTLGYEAQLVAAVINSSAAVKDRFHFEWYGPWENVIGKFDVKTNKEGKQYRVPSWKMQDEAGCGVKVWATLRGENEPRVLDLLLAQARTRNSTLWADDPKQQLAYLAQKRWARLYAPDVIMGVYDSDELAPNHVVHDMGMAEVVDPEPEAPEVWSDVAWKKTLPKILDGIQKGRTVEQALQWLRGKAEVTDAQEQELRTKAAELAPQPAAPEPEPTDGGPTITYAQVAHGLAHASSAADLDEAADLIGAVADGEQRAELTAIYDKRAAEFNQGEEQ